MNAQGEGVAPPLKAPFPWFGGKSKVAPVVWRAFAGITHYVEPFAGSLAVLHARHLWLVAHRERITECLLGSPDYYDVKAAGWWVWGLSLWIGSGWCSGKGPWHSVDGQLVKGEAGMGVHRKRLHLGDAGRGVHRQRLHLGDPGGYPLGDWLAASPPACAGCGWRAGIGRG